MCVISGKVDYIVQAMDDEIKKIVCMITELDDLAYATYKPIVEEICARKASESEVELFKCVCRKYIYLYPEMVTSEIYTYKSMYEEAGNDLTGANFAHVDGNGENH